MSARPRGNVVRPHIGFVVGRINPLARRAFPPAAASRSPKTDYFITSVVMRFGTSPTGTTAFTFMASVSMAVTDFMAALEM
jgi:hypothetical protein